jgi:hypothetical protein
MYRASCGHIFPTQIPCDTAFKLASKQGIEPKCEKMVTFQSPLCSHMINAPCWVQKLMSPWNPWGPGGIPLIIHENNLSENNNIDAPMEIKKYLKNLCDKSLSIIRNCGKEHTDYIKCNDVYSYISNKKVLSKCSSLIIRVLPCSHDIKVECCKFNDPNPVCREIVNERFVYPCGEHSISGDTCNKLQLLKSLINPHCNVTVPCVRYLCSHTVHVPCHLKSYVQEKLTGEHISLNDNNNNINNGNDSNNIDNNSNNDNKNNNNNDNNGNSSDNQIRVIADTLYCATANNIDPCMLPVTYVYSCGHSVR